MQRWKLLFYNMKVHRITGKDPGDPNNWEKKETKIEPNLPIEKFSILDYLGNKQNLKWVYEITATGILKTQFSLDTRWHHFSEYYYKQENGKLVRIPFVVQGRDVESKKDIDPNTVHVSGGGTGSSGKTPSGPHVVFGQFYVGTERQIRKAGEEGEKINPIDLVN